MENYFSYEYSRDANVSPACWKTENNACPPHFHASIELVYVSKGALTVTLNGQTMVVTAGQFLIVPSYTIHRYATEKHSSCYILIFPLEFLSSYKPILLKKTFSFNILKKSSIHGELLHCLNAIYHTFHSGHTPYSKNQIKGYTYVIFSLLMDEVGLIDIPDSKMTARVQDILIYLQEHYLEPLTLEETSDYFGYSKSRFSHIFNGYFGCSLTQYLNRLRCQHALELMKAKKTSITDIALTSGFESTRTFYRAFHACFGISPKQYTETTSL